MKFGKSLSNQIEETLPEWQDKFLSYKDLKKKLKLMEPRGAENRPNKRSRSDPNSADAADPTAGMTKEEIDFIRLLEDELEKFNCFFVEKEEEYIIRLKVTSLIYLPIQMIYYHLLFSRMICFLQPKSCSISFTAAINL